MKYKSISWTDKQIKSFWQYESQFPERYFSYQVAGNLVRKLHPFIAKAKSVIDYGCGNGDLISELLKQTNAKISGVEFSAASINIVNKRFFNDKNYIPLAESGNKFNNEERVDLVISCEVIEHLNDKMLWNYIEHIKVILEEDGRLIITTPNNEDLNENILFCPDCQHTFHRWQHMRSWSSQSLSSFLHKAGFQVEHVFEKDFCIAANPFKTPFFLLRRIFLKYFKKQKNPHLVVIAILKPSTDGNLLI